MYQAVAWIGQFFWQIEGLSCTPVCCPAVVQHNFTLVVLGIVAVSVLPVVLEVTNCDRLHGFAL